MILHAEYSHFVYVFIVFFPFFFVSFNCNYKLILSKFILILSSVLNIMLLTLVISILRLIMT